MVGNRNTRTHRCPPRSLSIYKSIYKSYKEGGPNRNPHLYFPSPYLCLCPALRFWISISDDGLLPTFAHFALTAKTPPSLPIFRGILKGNRRRVVIVGSWNQTQVPCVDLLLWSRETSPSAVPRSLPLALFSRFLMGEPSSSDVEPLSLRFLIPLV